MGNLPAPITRDEAEARGHSPRRSGFAARGPHSAGALDLSEVPAEWRERFWAKVQCGSASECWPWTGSRAGEYGQARLPNGKKALAHRIAYALMIGVIPAGITIDHAECDNPICANPYHLKQATQKQNSLRSESNPLAINARKTHCLRGHLLQDDNLEKSKNGRKCRECRRGRYSPKKRKERYKAGKG